VEYTTLGNTGLLVSKLCLGTMTFGPGQGDYKLIGNLDQKGADEHVKGALDAGVNFFDTADIYSDGESEKILGQSFDIRPARAATSEFSVRVPVNGRVCRVRRPALSMTTRDVSIGFSFSG
jgi:aryl-alcohol dehydrogenase-like predicted oxidoreductase